MTIRDFWVQFYLDERVIGQNLAKSSYQQLIVLHNYGSVVVDAKSITESTILIIERALNYF